jgi:hypothetical protein
MKRWGGSVLLVLLDIILLAGAEHGKCLGVVQ